MKLKLVFVAFALLVAGLPIVQATHDPNDFFALEAAFPGYVWNDIHGSSTTNVFAVGENSGVSAIARRTGAGWALETGVPNIGPLNQVSVSPSGTRAYATGMQTANVLKWNGAAWANLALPAGSLGVSVFAFSNTVVGFGGNDNTPPLGNTEFITYDDAVFVVDECAQGPTVVQGALTTVFSFSGTQFFGWSNLASVASVGHVATTASFDCGRSFVSVPVGVNDLWMYSATDANALSVGDDGTILQGVSIPTSVTSPTTQNLNAIWGLSSTNIWAAGDMGTIIHATGPTTWTLEPALASSENLNGVYFSDASNGWVVSSTGSIFKLQVNPNVAAPILTGLQWDPNDLLVTTDDACLGDEVALGVNLEPSLGAGGLTAYVINDDTGVVVESWTGPGFAYNLQNKRFSVSKTYPTGEYTFLVTADVIGLLTPDNWAAESFNVDTGSCYTAGDALVIENRFDTLESNLTQLIEAIDIIVNLTAGDTIIMAFANALDGSVNLTLFLILAFIIIATWLYTRKPITIRIMAILLLLIPIFLALAIATDFTPGGIFALLIAVYGFGLAWHLCVEELNGRRENRKNSEMKI